VNSLESLSTGALLVTGLALLFAFSNGFRDSSSIVATVVSTRALSARKAFFFCAIFEFMGAFLIGSAVLMTIGKGLFSFPVETNSGEILILVGSGLLAAIFWGGVSWWRAWPTSNNQALLGGLLGASLSLWGWESLNAATLIRVLLVLVLSPVIGFTVSTGITFLIRFAGEWMTPKVKPIMQRFHIGACLMVSCAHGSNDGQIVMGLIFLLFGLFQAGPDNLKLGSYDLSVVIRFVVALSLASGVLLGGKRILKKMGMKFYRIRPSQGLGAQLASAGTILACTVTGFPASTMQVITGSVVGAGVAKNPKAVRWHVAEEIVFSWMITLPTASLIGFSLCSLASAMG